MFSVNLGEGVSVVVDRETAEQLKDPNFANDYLQMVKHELNKESVPTTQADSTLWKSKHGNQIDHEATLAFLALRNTYKDKFCDKKTCKNTLWSKIRNEMNGMGYFVGERIPGREKVRQKFANLQSAYFKTKEKRRRTGEGKVEDSPYFKEVDRILGDQHKTEPVLLIDSIKSNAEVAQSSSCSGQGKGLMPKPCENTVSTSSKVQYEDLNAEEGSSRSCETLHKDKAIDRFQAVKNSVRPQTLRNKSLEQLIQIQRENQDSRREEFRAMMEMFMTQSSDRHKESMALIESLSSNPSKKRKMDEDN